MLKRLLLGTSACALTVLLVQSWPDIKRYWKIRRM